MPQTLGRKVINSVSFFLANYRHISTFFEQWLPIEGGKEGIVHLEQPKSHRKLFFLWGGCRHIYVYWLHQPFFFSLANWCQISPPYDEGRNHHNRRFYFQFTTHCCWMRITVPVCIQSERSFRQISSRFLPILQFP